MQTMSRRSGYKRGRHAQAGRLAWLAAIPDIVWAPVTAGLLMLSVGLVGLAFSQPWLFPSLGPSAYLRSERPGHEVSRLYNTLAGHMVGLGLGFLAVAVFDAWDAPAVVSSGIITLPRVEASALAVALTVLFNSLFRSSHPPAAATTLLVALGAFSTSKDALVVFAGVLLMAAVSEVFRQLRLRAGSR